VAPSMPESELATTVTSAVKPIRRVRLGDDVSFGAAPGIPILAARDRATDNEERGRDMTPRTRKVLAYVTRGNDLLVFEHRDYPEVGIQVPAGTVRAGEGLEDAVLREVFEETGLGNVRIVAYLGSFDYDMAQIRDEIQERHVYHLEVEGSAPTRWQHFETHDGQGTPTAFDCYWMNLDDPKLDLSAGQGQLLGNIRTSPTR
jgi:8-oxo-dGTP pyrophosphatase MutT (NUDIX family)